MDQLADTFPGVSLEQDYLGRGTKVPGAGRGHQTGDSAGSATTPCRQPRPQQRQQQSWRPNGLSIKLSYNQLHYAKKLKACA